MRLFTAGVFEGDNVGVSEGVDVSVEVSVGVREAVCVAVGARGVNDSVGGFGVFVGGSFPMETEGGVKLQASIIRIKRVEKTSFRLIGNVVVFLSRRIDAS